MIKPIHVITRAVIIDQDHILLCRPKDRDPGLNFYFLPGGHIEQGESAEVALLREIKEELNASITITRFLGCLEYTFIPTHQVCHNHEYNFIFEAHSNNIKVSNPLPQLESHIEFEWIPFHSIDKINLKPIPLHQFLPEWLSCDLNLAFKSYMEKF